MGNKTKAEQAAKLIWNCWQNGQAIKRFWDSTSEMRYFVIPEQSVGTKDWSEENFMYLVTRNSMIGVEFAKEPPL